MNVIFANHLVASLNRCFFLVNPNGIEIKDIVKSIYSEKTILSDQDSKHTFEGF